MPDTATPAWTAEQWHASAALLAARPMPVDGRRRISLLTVRSPALILGSSGAQRDRAEALVRRRLDAGSPSGAFEVTGRRSGGGAVWLHPQEATWLDVFVPRGDPLWSDDLSASALWLGERCAAAFASLGFDAEVHRGALVPGPAPAAACFGSLGPGEVSSAGRKLVGISQRRTRAGSRFQCLWYRRFRLGPIRELLGPGQAAAVRARAAGWADLAGAPTRLRASSVTHAVIAAVTV